jgi:hypothetical protein
MELKLKPKEFIKMQEQNNVAGKTNNESYKPSDEQKERYKNHMSTWNSYINFRTEYDEKWKECVARYKAEPFFYEDGRAGVVLPVGKFIIETAQAQESKSPPSFAYSASEFPEDIKKASIMEYVVKKHVWYRKFVDLDYKLDILNQDKMILGTMYQYIGWKRLYRTIRERTKGGKIEAKLELYYDDIAVENIYPQDVWLHPLASCVAESPMMFIRRRFDFATFLEQHSDPEMFYNINLVKAGQYFQGYDNGGETLWRNLADNRDGVTVIEVGDKMRDEVTLYANGVEIYYGPNPYEDKELPLTDYRNRLQYNTYLGESEMERIATISDALNAFVNIAIDKEKRAASGINLLDNNLSDFDDVGSLFSSTEAIRTENPKDSFVHYDMPGMSASTDKMIQMLMDFLVYATGIDFRQITDLSSSTKATVAALRREISLQRVNLNVNRNENCGVKRLGWLLAKRVQQFYTMPLVEEITGQDLSGLDTKKKKKDKLEYRQLRLPDIDMQEVPGKNGAIDAGSLRIKGKKDGSVSFIPARPEYLRLRGDISVKVIPGSTMGAIAELQKTKAKEYIDVATTILKPAAEQGGVPMPYLSVKHGLEQYVKAMGYDVDKAFDTADKDGETVAQDQAKQLISGMSSALNAPIASASPQQGAVVVGNDMKQPEAQPPAALTGQRSEAMRELGNKMGVNNRVTNKRQ